MGPPRGFSRRGRIVGQKKQKGGRPAFLPLRRKPLRRKAQLFLSSAFLLAFLDFFSAFFSAFFAFLSAFLSALSIEDGGFAGVVPWAKAVTVAPAKSAAIRIAMVLFMVLPSLYKVGG